jgi:hypothetical protein
LQAAALQGLEQSGVFLTAIYPGLGEQVSGLADDLVAEEREPPAAAAQAAAAAAPAAGVCPGAVHSALSLGVGPVRKFGMLGTDYHIRWDRPICRVDRIGTNLRAIKLDEGGHGHVLDLPAEG